jgi:hypothetical protein
MAEEGLLPEPQTPNPKPQTLNLKTPGMAEEGLLPRAITIKTPKTGTPLVPILIGYSVVITISLLVPFGEILACDNLLYRYAPAAFRV